MTRSELVARLAETNRDLAVMHIEPLVDAFFDIISRHLADGGRVEFRGFGAFLTRTCPAGAVRNPRTGETVMLGMRRIPVFRPGRDVSRRINGQGAEQVGPPTTGDAG